ncbi:MAG: thaumarchaeosortase [Thaumarchaeota archaeon]|nr:thaumarchaeosortase [Nitrososphaerota archaeon]
MNNRNIHIVLMLVLPVLFVIILQPDSFNLSWNQGRGGFIFALTFVFVELFLIPSINVSKTKFILAISAIMCTVSYFVFLDRGLEDYFNYLISLYDINLSFSWLTMWDFLVMAIFVSSILSIFLGSKWLKLAPASPIFLFGNSIILFLDAIFPYDTLGALQYFVPYIVQINANLITIFGIGTIIAKNNLLFLDGDHGPFALQVFWPSAGVHSIIIYSLVMIAFLLKMNITATNKFIYFIIGIIGTILANILRIFLLSIFVLKISSNPIKFEEFHSVAGEIIFIPWLIIFLLIVTAIEYKKSKN